MPHNNTLNPLPFMTFTCFVGDDAYEIFYTLGSGVDSIVRYRQGRDGRGEEIDFDSLPQYIQTEIYQKFKREVAKHHDEDRT